MDSTGLNQTERQFELSLTQIPRTDLGPGARRVYNRTCSSTIGEHSFETGRSGKRWQS